MADSYFNLNFYKEKYRNTSIQSKLLILWLFLVFFIAVANFVMHRFGLDEGFLRESIVFVISCVPLTLFFVNIKKIDKEDYRDFFILMAIVLAVIGITAWLNPAVRPFLVRPQYGLERVLIPNCAIYGFLFFSLLNDPKEILRDLRIFALVDFLYLITVELVPALIEGAWVTIGPDGKYIRLSYSLSFGYGMLIPVCILLYFAVKEKKFLDLILGIIGFYFIIEQGNRGAFLILLLYIATMGISFFIDAEGKRSKLIVLVKILLIYAIIFVFLNLIIPGISDLINYFLGRTSNEATQIRNVDMIKSGNFTDSNGRKAIWGSVENAIKKGGILGYGFFGDRPFVYKHHYVAFSHNLFLEFVASFGVLGFIICIYFAIESIRMIFFCKDTEWRNLFILLFIPTCQLLLSMSFWYIWTFWATFAVLIKYRRLTGTGFTNKIKYRLSHNKMEGQRGV